MDKIETHSTESKPYGRSWQEWIQHWWQWCYAGDIQDSPARDKDGSSCGKNQNYAEVWFLAGTFGTRVERRCLIPLGRSIFFPVLNDIISFASDTHLKTEEELSTYAKADLDETKFLYVSVNGFELRNLEEHRILTQIFEITIPQERQGARKATRAVSDGYWVFLKPLPAGNHIIHLIGEKLEYDKSLILDKASLDLQRFRVEVVYELTVE